MTRPVPATAVRDDSGLADGVFRAGQLPRLAVVAVAGDWSADRDDEPGFGVDDDLVVGQMAATGPGFGILPDAVVIRTLLVPALVAITGRANWWMPRGLGRILRVPQISDTSERNLKAPASYRSSDLEDTYPDPSGRRI